jgi:hypothetical protein
MCPPVYGYVPPTRHISLMGSPYSFARGGVVSTAQATIPKEMLPHGDVDTVPARLQPGELVIPVKHVAMVKSYLISKKINLPNM